MSKSKEYKAVRNYFVNELGLSKDQVREIAVEAIRDEARKVAQHSIQSGSLVSAVQTVVKEVLLNNSNSYYGASLKSEVAKTLANVLRDKITISVEE